MSRQPVCIVHHFESGSELPKATGPGRLLDIGGRVGWHALGLKSQLRVEGHTLNQDRGCLTFWLCPLDDLSARPHHENHERFDPKHATYTMLSDQPGSKDNAQAAFKIAWDSGWNPQFYCSFVKGKYAFCWNLPREAEFDSGFLVLRRDCWYQIGCSWDRPGSRYRLYVNGVLVATSDQFETPLRHDAAGETLYAGDPSWAVADFAFYGEGGDDAWFREQFEGDRLGVAPEADAEIARTFLGRELPAFKFEPDAGWESGLELGLSAEVDLEHFYVQGKQDAHRITAEGLRVETYPDKTRREDVERLGGRNMYEWAPWANVSWSIFDDWQVYFWTWREFEGDLYVEVEFNPLDDDGLALLIVQAAGLHREDFMRDNPLRISGSMATIHQQDVRNYHWEFYREIADARQDVANSALFKNPWLHPMAFQCEPERCAKQSWHRLQFLQVGARLRGAIDGRLLFDVTDNPFINQGPVLRKGHVALRCMCQTKMLFRNLKILQRNEEFRVLRSDNVK